MTATTTFFKCLNTKSDARVPRSLGFPTNKGNDNPEIKQQGD